MNYLCAVNLYFLVLLRIMRFELYKHLSMLAGRMASVNPVKPEFSGTEQRCAMTNWDI